MENKSGIARGLGSGIKVDSAMRQGPKEFMCSEGIVRCHEYGGAYVYLYM
jgi:hypothetical protein